MQPVNLNTLPAQVQTVLRSQLAGANPSSITQQMTPNGLVYTVTSLQNGTPVQFQVGANGQVLSTPRTANNGAAARGPAANTQGVLGNVAAGLPLNNLPPQLQSAVRTQLGNSQVQSISQDQSPNGTVYRVTALQNGRPVEFQFAANGVLLGSNPLSGGLATSPFGTGVAATVPGTQVVLDDLPEDIQGTIREQTGDNQITGIRQQDTPNGPVYWVAYDQDGRPARMRVDANGNVRTSADFAAAGEARSNNGTSVTLDELPEAVSATLKEQAPQAEIVTLQREERPQGEVFTVSFRDEQDRYTVLVIDAEGEVIRDSRDVPMIAVGETTKSKSTDELSGYRYETLPAAVKNAVKAYAAEGDIRAIHLTRYRGDTVFSVVFMRDARRDQMLVTKAGDVLRIQEDVAPAVVAGSDRAPDLAIGDLPPAVRDTIRRQTDQVMVDEIKMDVAGDQTVYKVSYRTNNTPVELLVGTDGTVVRPIGNLDGAGAALPAPISEEAPVRTVDVAEAQAEPSEAAGLPARRETGTEAAPPAEKPIAEEASVNLQDVPLPVQTAAKKLAGNALIKSIAPKLHEGQLVYAVSYEQAGKERTVRLDKQGKLLAKEEPEK